MITSDCNMYSKVSRPRAYDIQCTIIHRDRKLWTHHNVQKRVCRQACENRHECQLDQNGRLEPKHGAAHVQLLVRNTGNSSIIISRSWLSPMGVGGWLSRDWPSRSCSTREVELLFAAKMRTVKFDRNALCRLQDR